MQQNDDSGASRASPDASHSGSAPDEPTIDIGRRRLAKAGVAAGGVLATVASRSALGGWGTCTGSEIASGNLSRQGEANPCGCSPGFWWNKNGLAVWTGSILDYPPMSSFDGVFGVSFFQSADVTLFDCGPGTGSPALTPEVDAVTGNNTILYTCAFHAVAALLNAAFYGSRYPVPGMDTPASVISAFQAALNTSIITKSKNALVQFKDTVDIYDKTPNLWCWGAPEFTTTPTTGVQRQK